MSEGAGNVPGMHEVHIAFVDPEDGTEMRGWFSRDELLSAIFDPNPPLTRSLPENVVLHPKAFAHAGPKEVA